MLKIRRKNLGSDTGNKIETEMYIGSKDDGRNKKLKHFQLLEE